MLGAAICHSGGRRLRATPTFHSILLYQIGDTTRGSAEQVRKAMQSEQSKVRARPPRTHNYMRRSAHTHRKTHSCSHMRVHTITFNHATHQTHLHNLQAHISSRGSYMQPTVPNHTHTHAHTHSQIRPRWINSNFCETMSRLSRMPLTR